MQWTRAMAVMRGVYFSTEETNDEIVNRMVCVRQRVGAIEEFVLVR